MHTPVADEILRQLGAATLAMLGAQRVVKSKDAIAFQVRGSARVTHVVIGLDPGDTYTLTFGKFFGVEFVQVDERSDVYAESLRDVIAQVTGLGRLIETATTEGGE